MARKKGKNFEGSLEELHCKLCAMTPEDAAIHWHFTQCYEILHIHLCRIIDMPTSTPYSYCTDAIKKLKQYALEDTKHLSRAGSMRNGSQHMGDYSITVEAVHGVYRLFTVFGVPVQQTGIYSVDEDKGENLDGLLQ